jgi:hypothetical protein
LKLEKDSFLDKAIRSFYYFRVGYATYLSLPLGIIGFCTTVYYLFIQSFPILKTIFSDFITFGIITVLALYPLGSFIGWLHMKGFGFFNVEQDVATESNKYMQNKLAPINIPMFKILLELARKEGLDASTIEEMERILSTKTA